MSKITELCCFYSQSLHQTTNSEISMQTVPKPLHPQKKTQKKFLSSIFFQKKNEKNRKHQKKKAFVPQCDIILQCLKELAYLPVSSVVCVKRQVDFLNSNNVSYWLNYVKIKHFFPNFENYVFCSASSQKAEKLFLSSIFLPENNGK